MSEGDKQVLSNFDGDINVEGGEVVYFSIQTVEHNYCR